ncbi:MAG: VOC family protein [Halieaceae bacterium]|nr:VOC family protein [Halieaceae bacterium]
MNVRSLGYVWIESTDPGKWLEYATEVLGMAVAEPRGGAVLYLRMDERPFRLAIVKGATDSLQLCGWELLDEADFTSAKSELDAASVSWEQGSAEEIRSRRVRDLIRLQDPAGNSLELYHGGDLDYAKFVSPQGIDRFETGFNGNMGFGHAVLPAPNLQETHQFYRDLLGFGDSDYMHFHFTEDQNDPGLGLHFMHVQNPRHHSLGLFQGESPGNCVHLMVEVMEVDEVGYCLDRALQKEIPITSTLGRHTNDRMLSFYMLTPGGFSMEFGCQGLKMDWSDYTPTKTTSPSIWGHVFAPTE